MSYAQWRKSYTRFFFHLYIILILVFFLIMPRILLTRPVTVAEPSNAWSVFVRTDAGTVGSNPTQGMDV
jgi:hypothetical protein